MTHSYAYIYSHFFGADVCLPYTMLLKAVADTSGISETSLRAPALVGGISSLLVLPILVWRRFGRVAAIVFAGALAISPYLVHFSRYARPYGIVALLTTLAIFSFYDWWTTRRRVSAAVYVWSAVLACYFHLLAAFAVFSPFAWAAVGILRESSPDARRASALRTVRLALPAGLILTLLLLPPFFSSSAAMLGKVMLGEPDLETLIGGLYVLAGTSSTAAMGLFWSICLGGVILGAARHSPLTSLLGVAIVAQGVGVVLVAPDLVERPNVFSRYVVFVLPLVLVLFSLPFAELARGRSDRVAALILALAAAILSILFFAGPIPHWISRPGNFSSHPINIPTGNRVHRLPTKPASSFYRRLGREREPFAIIEAPWYPFWSGTRYFRLQNLHGKEVFVGFTEPRHGPGSIYEFPVRGHGLDFERFVDLHDCADVAETGSRYLILHHRVPEDAFTRRDQGERKPPAPQVAKMLRRMHGAPVFRDPEISVFDLERGSGSCGRGGGG